MQCCGTGTVNNYVSGSSYVFWNRNWNRNHNQMQSQNMRWQVSRQQSCFFPQFPLEVPSNVIRLYLLCFAVESKDQFPDESSGGKTSATFLSAQVSVRPLRGRGRRGRGAPHTGATPQQISAPRYVPVTSVPDPWHFGTDPDADPYLTKWCGSGFGFSSFRQWPSGCQQKKKISPSFYALKAHLHHSSKIKGLKEVT